MPAQSGSTARNRVAGPRAFLYGLLVAFNAFLWLLLWAFNWQISLRAREVQYFGTRLFPIEPQVVPLQAIYAACALLSVASVGVILRDRSNVAVREKLQTLLAQILESLEIGVAVLDPKGHITLTNESARKVLKEMSIGSPDEHFLEALQKYTELKEIVKSAVEKESFVRELENTLVSGGESYPVRITTLPLKDRGKRAGGTLLLVNDVREAVAMERQMRTAERLSAVGTLAAALAHEIRNPLEAMNLNLELLERSLEQQTGLNGEDGKKRKYLRILDSEVSRLAGIVDNFLSFARPSKATQGPVRLDELLERIVELIENQARSRGVEIALGVRRRPVAIVGSEDQLKQVFLNLMINSLEAMPDGGRLGVQLDVGVPSAATSPMAVVRIQDAGEGIPPEKINRLFDPFFSTRPKGTGLGLTIAHRVIEDHQGRISVESVTGKGSVFTVELPLAAGNAGAGTASPNSLNRSDGAIRPA